MTNSVNMDISKRATLLKATTEKNLSRYCLVLISNIMNKSTDKEEMAGEIHDIVVRGRVEQDIVDRLQLRYSYLIR